MIWRIKKQDENKYLFKMAELWEVFPAADLETQIKIDEETHYLLVRATKNTLLITPDGFYFCRV